MISKYIFKNFCSFSEISEFDMVASQTKARNRFPDNFVKSDTDLLPLKTAVIVGENAGGKSNFIRSLRYLKSLFKENQNVRSSISLVNTNHLCSDSPLDCDTTQLFELEVVIKGLIYNYSLEFDFLGITNEKLHVRNKRGNVSREILNISRNKEEFDNENSDKLSVRLAYTVSADFPDQVRSLVEEKFENSENLGLFITRIALLGQDEAVTFVNWMNNMLYAEAIDVNYDLYMDYKREEDDFRILKDKRYVNILKMVDYSIVDIEVDDDKPYSKTKLKRRKEDGSYFDRELMNDSTGVREFFAWAVQIFRVVYENKVIFADEMDRVLNPVLSDRIITFINGMNHTGQFIFTTHNVLHLDLKNYMKEQIYFVTKNSESLNSEIYSLADFPEVRYETTKIYEFYMKGVLGGTSYE